MKSIVTFIFSFQQLYRESKRTSDLETGPTTSKKFKLNNDDDDDDDDDDDNDNNASSRDATPRKGMKRSLDDSGSESSPAKKVCISLILPRRMS